MSFSGKPVKTYTPTEYKGVSHEDLLWLRDQMNEHMKLDPPLTDDGEDAEDLFISNLHEYEDDILEKDTFDDKAWVMFSMLGIGPRQEEFKGKKITNKTTKEEEKVSPKGKTPKKADEKSPVLKAPVEATKKAPVKKKAAAPAKTTKKAPAKTSVKKKAAGKAPAKVTGDGSFSSTLKDHEKKAMALLRTGKYTMGEVKAELGTTYYNMLKKAEASGEFTVVKNDARKIKVTLKKK